MLVSVCNIHTVPSYASTVDRFFFLPSQRGNWDTSIWDKGHPWPWTHRGRDASWVTPELTTFPYFLPPWCPKYRIIFISPHRYSFSGETEAIWNKIILLLGKDTEELDRGGRSVLPSTYRWRQRATQAAGDLAQLALPPFVLKNIEAAVFLSWKILPKTFAAPLRFKSKSNKQGSRAL